MELPCKVLDVDLSETPEYLGCIIAFSHIDRDPVAIVRDEKGFLHTEYLKYIQMVQPGESK